MTAQCPVNFTFFGDYLKNIADLPRDEQNEIIIAIVRYTSLGEQPEFSKNYLSAIFNCIKFSLDKSVSAGNRGQGRKSNKNQNEIKLKSNENQIEIKTKSNGNQTQSNKNKNKNKNNISEFTYVNSSPQMAHADLGQTDEKKNKNISPPPHPQANQSPPSTVQDSLPGMPPVGDNPSPIPPRKQDQMEFEFYIWCFNRLFKTKLKQTQGRKVKFKSRRKSFSLMEIVASLQVMANERYYHGENERQWQADPEFHLRNDENIARFLEKPISQSVLADLTGREKELKQKFMADRKEQNDN